MFQGLEPTRETFLGINKNCSCSLKIEVFDVRSVDIDLASERNAGILFEHFKGKLVMLGKMLSISSTIKKNAQKVCSSRVFFDRRPPLRR